jgi:hypothetical protein
MKNKLPLRFYWLFVCEFLFRFLAWAVVPTAMLFLKKIPIEETKDKVPYGIGGDLQRYKFPKWLDCLDMIDDLLWPEYEPTMSKIRKKFGWQVATWVNLSFRNVGMGIMAEYAVPVSGYWYLISDEEKAEKGLFDNSYILGFLVLKVGYVSYRDWKQKFGNTGYFALPRITLRLRSQD